MRQKNADLTLQIAGGLAAIAAGYATRKLVTVVWRKAVGKEPPSNPDSLEIGLGEAIGWAVFTGVATEVGRVLAIRATARALGRGTEVLPDADEL
ncbi:DUF4235 domain-containing protein [Allonocardiopsis opalescens]|uniref:Uncharacterized protein DUF4235 n=1 Tax=Allonocardiopsis opalescens TaxID=1144618 RepID=A0A2T0PU60_9ACTN|nr:DUF4235 domain-containing protein [Allonocardiopsis opalescens]PRX92433.1 uncharacterized protein DUF4235 [Allonocardiopsis opalescens]